MSHTHYPSPSASSSSLGTQPSAGPSARRFPAEWELHDATWLSWPHNASDWPEKFGPIEWVFTEIVRGVVGPAVSTPSVLAHYTKHAERLELLCHDQTDRERAEFSLREANVNINRVRLHVLESDRGWMRDSGPTFVHHTKKSGGGKSQLEMIDWKFSAWAKYPEWQRDDLTPSAMESILRLPRVEALRPDNKERIVIEGGGIETDGRGTLLVTEECFLHQEQQVRNPGLSREGYERAFAEYLGINRTLWLSRGCVGDDTHGHIDDVARFVPSPDETPHVLLAFEPDKDDENHASSIDNERILKSAGVRVTRLPYPNPVYFSGQRLPASYANFYVANAAVLVPTFNDRHDRLALDAIAGCFPDRPTVGVHALDLVWGLGTLHCLTQQQPAPV